MRGRVVGGWVIGVDVGREDVVSNAIFESRVREGEECTERFGEFVWVAFREVDLVCVVAVIARIRLVGFEGWDRGNVWGRRAKIEAMSRAKGRIIVVHF